jgi:chromosomal replication initiation ATPase DnaA
MSFEGSLITSYNEVHERLKYGVIPKTTEKDNIKYIEKLELRISNLEIQLRAFLHQEAAKKVAPTGILHEIIHLLVENEEVSKLDVVSGRRTRQISYARQLGMYLARVYTAKSYPQIGNAFGSKDHTTVMYAYEKVKKMVAADPELKKRCEWYGRKIKDIAASISGDSGETS